MNQLLGFSKTRQQFAHGLGISGTEAEATPWSKKSYLSTALVGEA